MAKLFRIDFRFKVSQKLAKGRSKETNQVFLLFGQYSFSSTKPFFVGEEGCHL